MHSSLYTVDLGSSSGPVVGLHDPLTRGLSVHAAFRVAGFAASVSTGDMHRALAAGIESEEEAIRRPTYEIVWADDESFFVGARTGDDAFSGDGPSATTSLVASHVRSSLHAGLGDVDVVPLADHLRDKYDAAETTAEPAAGIVGSLVSAASLPFRVLGGVLGFGKRRGADDRNGEGASKRRRLD